MSYKIFKNGPFSAFFCFFMVFSKNNENLITNQCEKMSIQYLVVGFEPLPLVHESSPITTKLGMSHYVYKIVPFSKFPTHGLFSRFGSPRFIDSHPSQQDAGLLHRVFRIEQVRPLNQQDCSSCFTLPRYIGSWSYKKLQFGSNSREPI